MTSVNGERLKSVGKIAATLSAGSTSHTTTIHVYDDLNDALLSRTSLAALGFLPENWQKQMPRVAAVQSDQPPMPTTDEMPRVAAVQSDQPAMPTPDEILHIRNGLLHEFADVFADSPLCPMPGPPMDIELEANAKPSHVAGARALPYAYRDQVRQQLEDMVTGGIIEPVSEPSDWCHPIVVVRKKGTDEMRLTVDFKKLNDQVCRPVHPTRSPRDVIANIGDAQFFTTLDARHGYWQVPLSDEAKPLTTFISPWGRYRFLRNPQGLISAGDEFNRWPDTSTPHTQRSPRLLSTLSIGTHVDIQDPRTKRWTKRGVIVAIGSHRDYFVKLPSGRVYWRNRRFLRPYRPLVPTPPEMSVAQSGPTSQLPAPVPRRSSHTRRAPDRLNVHSTSGQSYIWSVSVLTSIRYMGQGQRKGTFWWFWANFFFFHFLTPWYVSIPGSTKKVDSDDFKLVRTH